MNADFLRNNYYSELKNSVNFRLKETVSGENEPIHKDVAVANIYDRAIKTLENDISKINNLQNGQFSLFHFGSRLISFLSLSIFSGMTADDLAVKKKQAEETKYELSTRLRRDVPKGVRNGLLVLDLQKKLGQSGLSSDRRDEINTIIAKIFTDTDDYTEMCDLRKTIEGNEVGTSLLHKLVYNDVDRDTCHTIIKSINETAKIAYDKDPSQVKFSFMVYSDIDDTIKGSLNDRTTGITDHYPGVMEFYKQLTQAPHAPSENPNSLSSTGENSSVVSPEVKLTFLSARPEAMSSFSNEHIKKSLPDDRKFYALYGSTEAIAGGVKHYLIKALAYLANHVLTGDLQKKVKEILNSSEFETYAAFARDKRRNIDRDLLLKPEVRPIMVGDCGEGDLMFMLLKNTGTSNPIKDDRIPSEYQRTENWSGDPESPVNYPNRPLYLSFAHALSSQTEPYEAKPDPSYRKEYAKDLNTHVFDNYVDNALYCLKNNILDKNSTDAVIEQVEKWQRAHRTETNTMLRDYKLAKGITKFDEKDITNDQAVTLPAPLRYRMNLKNSVKSYHDFVKSNDFLNSNT